MRFDTIFLAEKNATHFSDHPNEINRITTGVGEAAGTMTTKSFAPRLGGFLAAIALIDIGHPIDFRYVQILSP